MPVILAGLGMAYLQAGRNKEAHETFLRALRERPYASPLRGLITVLIRQGNIHEACAAAKQMLAIWPEFRVPKYWLPFEDQVFVEEQRNACRLAGLPE